MQHEHLLRDLLSALEDVTEYLVAAIINASIEFSMEKLEALLSECDMCVYAIQENSDAQD